MPYRCRVRADRKMNPFDYRIDGGDESTIFRNLQDCSIIADAKQHVASL
jgi:hypothetical protein